MLLVQNEFRLEIFHPPYALDVANKPAIVSVNGATTGSVRVAYGGELTVVWEALAGSAGVKVTSAALVAPSVVTHQFNTNQRVVNLAIINQFTNTLGKPVVVLKAPPNAGVAPPQRYMLFLMNGKTYSPRARWIRLAV
jgi:hypothetical protein